MKTPEKIKPHAPKYKSASWEQYTPEQLAQWVVLLATRATHRAPGQDEKIKKDLADARNYLAMFEAWVDHIERQSAGSRYS